MLGRAWPCAWSERAWPSSSPLSGVSRLSDFSPALSLTLDSRITHRFSMRELRSNSLTPQLSRSSCFCVPRELNAADPPLLTRGRRRRPLVVPAARDVGLAHADALRADLVASNGVLEGPPHVRVAREVPQCAWGVLPPRRALRDHRVRLRQGEGHKEAGHKRYRATSERRGTGRNPPKYVISHPCPCPQRTESLPMVRCSLSPPVNR